MAYHMHPHLVEIKDFLECSGKEVGKNGKTLFKRFPGDTTILIRHDDEYCAIILKPVSFNPDIPDVEFRIPCRELALDRLQTFDKRCAQLKSWLRILGERLPPSRFRLSGKPFGSSKGR